MPSSAAFTTGINNERACSRIARRSPGILLVALRLHATGQHSLRRTSACDRSRLFVEGGAQLDTVTRETLTLEQAAPQDRGGDVEATLPVTTLTPRFDAPQSRASAA